MPLQYSGILEEHRAVRTRAGAFDLSHMGELFVEGPGAAPALAYALTTDPAKIKVGRAHYSMICFPEGGVLDDLIVYRLARSGSWSLPRQTKRRTVERRSAARFGASSRPRRPLAGDGAGGVAGPSIGGNPGAAHRRGFGRPALLRDRGKATAAGVPRLWLEPATPARTVSKSLSTWKPRRPSGTPCSKRARPRVFCRSGSGRATRCDSRPACRCTGTSSAPTPHRSRRARPRRGSRAGGRLRRSRRAGEGPRRRSAPEAGRPHRRGRGIARHGYEVFAGDRRIGAVTSGTLSPTLGEPIAMAYVAPSEAEPGTIVAVGIRTSECRPR